jgi:hypothetical protein
MQDAPTLLPDDPTDADDRALVDAVARTITPPKALASSSFILHAPLELLARARLLRLAPPDAAGDARRRIAEIAARYAQEGPQAAPAARPRSYAEERLALAALAGAIPAGDVDEADGALAWLLDRLPAATLVAGIADAVIPALGAAGHAPILLAMLLREPRRSAAYGALLRAPVRYLTMQGTARLTWPTHAASPTDAGGDLAAALLAPPHVEVPSRFIAPTMLAVEADGLSERLLAGPTENVSLADAERALLRVAAWSMLRDDPGHAPYGWSHCLTMPQGVLTVAAVARDRRAAIRVAATHVLGFRATLGNAELDFRPLPAPVGGSLPGASPEGAASIAFHTPAEETGRLRAALAGRAVAHPDAHLAKYTMACFDAAAGDPQAAPLFLAAAAYLGAWWDANPGAGFDG